MDTLDQIILGKTRDSELDYYGHAFHRNIGIINSTEQEQLRNACVAIPGMGGIGSAAVAALARTGVGNFRIADFGEYRLVNTNRQYGAATHTMGRNKAEVMAEIITSINPEATVSIFTEPITDFNIDDFLMGADIVVDGLDFFMPDTRSLLYSKARSFGLSVVLATQIGFTATLHVFSPGGMTFDDFFQIKGGMKYEDKMLSFLFGLTPGGLYKNYMDAGYIDIQRKRIPALGITCQIASGMAATETISILLERKKIKSTPHYSNFNAYLTKSQKGYLWLGNRNPMQQLKIWYAKNNGRIELFKKRVKLIKTWLKRKVGLSGDKRIALTKSHV